MKTICKGIALLFKTTLLALLVAALTPILYFAWRMGRPLTQPEFKGLTYYQFTEWRALSCQEYNVRFQKDMPCKQWRYVTADLFGTAAPAAFLFIESPEMFVSVTPTNVFPSLWSLFESLTWHINKSEVGHLQYFGHVPTPEEFKTMKLERELSSLP